jgi:molybdopterin-guanine dinucleotide biosynthesis protein A
MGGSPKGLERFGNRRLIDHVYSALNQVADLVVISSNDPDAYQWVAARPHEGIVLRDLHPGTGGLAGVESALVLHGGALVVAWDMPFVNASLLQALVDASTEPETDAVVPASDSPHGIEPFCAFYSARILQPLTAFLEKGGGSAHTFLSELPRVRQLPLSEVRRFGDPARLFFSVNTADDLERARAMATDLR